MHHLIKLLVTKQSGETPYPNHILNGESCEHLNGFEVLLSSFSFSFHFFLTLKRPTSILQITLTNLKENLAGIKPER